MGMMELLQTLGDKLGILEVARGQTTQSPAKIRTRTVTLAELTTVIRSEEVKALADQPAELTLPFDNIFEKAGLKIGTAVWTVEKLRQVLQSEEFSGLEREALQKRILEDLRAANVSAEDIVKDAIARDKVLDSFESYARKKMEDRRAAQERKISELEEKVRQLQGELSQVQEKRKTDEQTWGDWRRKKKANEQDMAWAIGFLIDHPVITITDE
jgi:hypothetical protein